MNSKCRICGNEADNRIYDARERMFGYGDVFRYFQCARCECLQIAEIPSDIARFYPRDYLSYGAIPPLNRIKGYLTGLRDGYVLSGKGIMGRLLNATNPNNTLRFLRPLSVTKKSRILDVGCGHGAVLNCLRGVGLRNLLGIDPFNREDLRYANGLEIRKMGLREVVGEWDIVIFLHSFEHVPDPAEALDTVSRLLAPGGPCVIGIPLASSYAWNYYGVNWVQLDAPRHYYLHSVKSMGILAERAGLKIRKVVHDSTAFQFWGSEQYLKGISLRDKRSYAETRDESIFSRKEIAGFANRARELNEQGRGDQALFYLVKSNDHAGREA
jgi:SAM-dependent methyltransferase